MEGWKDYISEIQARTIAASDTSDGKKRAWTFVQALAKPQLFIFCVNCWSFFTILLDEKWLCWLVPSLGHVVDFVTPDSQLEGSICNDSPTI